MFAAFESPNLALAHNRNFSQLANALACKIRLECNALELYAAACYVAVLGGGFARRAAPQVNFPRGHP
jgi:hypothetical protein